VGAHFLSFCGLALLLKSGSPLIEVALIAQEMPVDVMEWSGMGCERGSGAGVNRRTCLSKRDGN
jgi:hypothetical protein